MRTVTIFLIALLLNGCAFPYYGHRQIVVSDEPLQIIDKDSGKQINKAVVIPRYTDLKSGKIFFSHSFIYTQGDRFNAYQPKGLVFVIWPFLWFGKDIRIDGYIISAKGYEPAWSGLNGQYEADFRMHRRVFLIKCHEDNDVYSGFIKDIHKPIIKTEYSKIFNVTPKFFMEIHNEITSEELSNIDKIMGF